MPLPPWSNPVIGAGSTIQAVDIRELRQAIDERRAARSLPAVVWTDSVKVGGLEVGPAAGTPIKAVHFQELRRSTHDLWRAKGTLPYLPRWTGHPTGGLFAGTPISAKDLTDLRGWLAQYDA